LAGSNVIGEAHPRFTEFACGVMAFDATPAEIRDDPDLQREFPARELEGLTDGWLAWRSKEKIAFHREQVKRVAEYEARMAAQRAG
jgi:hypothetical protein